MKKNEKNWASRKILARLTEVLLGFSNFSILTRDRQN